MSIWALSDPHLSFGTPDKSMAVFGPAWEGHADKIAKEWQMRIGADDLVLLPGDISWAMRIDEVMPDLEWLHALPGTKLLLKGNHDYWWPSSSKMKKILPPSLFFIYNSAFDWHDVTIGGTRLWDTPEYSFEKFIEYIPNPKAIETSSIDPQETEKIFTRELERLEFSLKLLNPKAKHRIALTHYPPIGADLAPSRASAILEQYSISTCIFGHLHSLKKDCLPLFGSARGVNYILASCDAIDFIPLKIGD